MMPVKRFATGWLSAVTILVGLCSPTQVAIAEAGQATSMISIVKTAAIADVQLSTENLYLDSDQRAPGSRLCLGTSAQSVPYRIAADSQNGVSEFMLVNASGNSRIPYDVIWSDGKESHRFLSSQYSKTPVINSRPVDHCANAVSVVLNENANARENRGVHFDKLVFTIVVE